MGRLLDELAADSQAATPANLANLRISGRESGMATPANLAKPANLGCGFADSQHSQGLAAQKTDTVAMRHRLRKLADDVGIDLALVRSLAEPDLHDCIGLPEATLAAYLSALRDTADRMAGRAPDGETAVAYCKGCGPTWTHPEVAAVLPVVRGMPTSIACPWCHVRHAGLYVPRPRVECGECAHFQRDHVNRCGMGRCTAGHELALGEPMLWPHAKRECEKFAPGGPSP